MITKVKMKNFRRYTNQQINLDPQLTYISGENNAGKTTVFMAIEYAIFGRVLGFTSQSALVHPNQDKMGVEVEYNGKDGNYYKLQRMHEITKSSGKGKSKASGHYTLKKIGDEDENYIVSSDFPNDSEELLQLKIFETLGISKRLFDLAINIKQGEITEILEGSTNLDIILGVSAASMAEKQLRSKANTFEKEATQIKSLQSSKKALEDEKKTLKKQSKQYKERELEIQENVKEFQQKVDEFEKQEKELKPLKEAFRQYQGFTKQWDKEIHVLNTVSQQYNKLVGSIDSIEEYKKELNDLISSQSNIQENMKILEKQELDLQKNIRNTEREKGDLLGKISRREKLSDEQDATCEECGAIIDKDRVKLEIKQWKEDLNSLTSKMDQYETDLKQLRSKLKELQSEHQSSIQTITSHRAIIAQIDDGKKQLDTKKSEMDQIGETMLNAVIELYDEVKTYNENHEDVPIKIKRPDVEEDELPIEIDSEVIMARAIEQEYINILNTLENNITENKSQVITELKVAEAQLRDTTKLLKELKPRMEKLEKEVTNLTAQISKLQRKLSLAGDMRITSKIFKTLQEKLRSEAASSIAAKTLELHKKLSGNTEYKSIRIDPKRYVLYVHPHDLDSEVPAHAYEGGGHKLLLGLAYKLAVVMFVMKPPFILLDEPTYGLDTERRDTLFETLQQLIKSQLVLISHQGAEQIQTGTQFQVHRDDDVSVIEEVNA